MTSYSYVCTGEHPHVLDATRPMTTCPGFVLGVPCKAPLKRIGPGSRTKREKADAR